MNQNVKIENWTLNYSLPGWADDFSESIFFIGNGRMGARGYLSHEPIGRPIQRGLFIGGVFGEIKPGITDFVNLPTPIFDNVNIDGYTACLAGPVKKTLDLSTGTFNAEYILEANGKKLLVNYQRFFSPINPALLCQRCLYQAQHPMSLSVNSGILLDCVNSPVPDDQTKDNSEQISLAKLTESTKTVNGFKCDFIITGTNISLSQAITFQANGWEETDFIQNEHSMTQGFTAMMNADEVKYLDKITYILTSRDVDARIIPYSSQCSYTDALSKSENWWKQKWNTCDSNYFPDGSAERNALRYSMFQLICSANAGDDTVSIGARGLTHTRYKGCYFWDTDIFMLPFFLETDLKTAKNLCRYRIKTLDAAKKHSKKMNTLGARYPWMTAFDGTEQCETWDIGCSELHITADVAYALEQYYLHTKDESFYLEAAPVWVETARFWASRYTWNKDKSKADLLFVKGPDEYCGVVNNNLYTNVMVQHNLKLAIDAAATLQSKRPDIYSELNIMTCEIDNLQKLHDCISWPHDPETGHLTTDDNFHLLEPVDISLLKSNDGASYHQVCFDRLQRYKVVKQADVLLLMTRLPELFSDEEKLQAWKDFEPICLHDSTLSFASHALFAAMNGLEYHEYLNKALFLDIFDRMGNTGKEGLHLANMGELWLAVHALEQRKTKVN